MMQGIMMNVFSGILVAGDDHGSVHVYNLREMVKKMNLRKGVASSSRVSLVNFINIFTKN